MGIFVRMVGGRISADDDLAAWNAKVNADLEQVALLPAWVPAFDNDMAGDDPVEELLELFDAAANAVRKRFGAIQVTKCDLKRDLHSTLL
jgi:hypothetical protein